MAGFGARAAGGAGTNRGKVPPIRGEPDRPDELDDLGRGPRPPAWVTGDVFVRDRQAGTTVLASVATDGAQGASASARPRLSNDGGVVAFESRAENLVPGRTRGDTYVYARDLAAGTTGRVSVTATGGVPNDACFLGGVSASGRWVVFSSAATDIVPGDTNGRSDIFLRDWQAGTTVRVSLAATGAQANGDSFAPAISADGKVVAFQVSDAANLVPGDTNGARDVFVRVLGLSAAGR